MQTGSVNLHWTSDTELKQWVDSFSLIATQEMERQLDIPDEAIAGAISGSGISEETKQALLDSLTDEQREFIRSLKGKD